MRQRCPLGVGDDRVPSCLWRRCFRAQNLAAEADHLGDHAILVWTDAFMATGVAIYGSGTFKPKEVELLSIAFAASSRM
jgi:hypothetical protein